MNNLYLPPLPLVVQHVVWGKATLRLDFIGFLPSWLVLLKKITQQRRIPEQSLNLLFISLVVILLLLGSMFMEKDRAYFILRLHWLTGSRWEPHQWMGCALPDLQQIYFVIFFFYYFPPPSYLQNFRPWKTFKYLSPMENSEIQLPKTPHSSSVKDWVYIISCLLRHSITLAMAGRSPY